MLSADPVLVVFVLIVLIMLLFGNRVGLHRFSYGIWITVAGVAAIVLTVFLIFFYLW
jgi:hypothetical protein